MERKRRNLLIIIVGITIGIAFLIPFNNFMVLLKIYDSITYEENLQNSKSLIEKSELFDYQKYCKYRDYSGETYNVSNTDIYHHIDRTLIESLRLKIENDKKKFHIFPYQNFVGYWHKLIYSFKIINESLIYLTYNNNSIFKAEYANHTEIFLADNYYQNNLSLCNGNWYLNFTHIPFTSNISSTITLNDIFLVKMSLDYDYFVFLLVSEILTIEQYLCFNSNCQLLFVYFPLESKSHYI